MYKAHLDYNVSFSMCMNLKGRQHVLVLIQLANTKLQYLYVADVVTMNLTYSFELSYVFCQT